MALRERFPETSWTLLELAREPSDEGIRAREDFARRYQRPIFEFLLAVVRDPDVAEDLAQEFFTRLSQQGGLFKHAQREHGAFRVYLMSALRNLAVDYHRRSAHPGLRQTHPDQWSDGGWDGLNLSAFRPAEAAFHDAWVKTVLSEALSRVREICLRREQRMHLELFEARYLAEGNKGPAWEELGARYGLDQKTARSRADTVARHFRLVLRRMLRQQIAVESTRRKHKMEEAIDKEIEALLRPLGE